MQLLKKYLVLKLSFLLVLSVFCTSVDAKTEATAEEYIQKYKGIAISEMRKYGIPASIKLAQGLLESGIGQSRLATQANNHFGIKCHLSWNGQTIKHTDDAIDECFRVYVDPNQSYLDHSQFLVHRPRYSDLFKLKTNDYKGWAHGLKKAGYATNPRYAFMLIDVIERHQLYIYDMDLTANEMEVYRHRITEKDKGALREIRQPEVKIESNSEIALSTEAKTHLSTVFYNNRVKVVRLQRGETLNTISKNFNIPVFRLRNFNDLSAKEEAKPGDLVYLSNKKNKAKKPNHLVLSHETMWSISQDYGVKLSKLYKKNLLEVGQEPAEGAIISLRRNSKSRPKLRSPKEIKEMKRDQLAAAEGKTETEKKPTTESVKESNTIGERIAAKKESNAEVTTSTSHQLNGKEQKLEADSGMNYHPFNYASSSSIRINAPTTTPQRVVYHQVQQGDTLYNVSKKYDVSVEDLKEWNEMNSNDIQLQQQLIIYNR